MQVKKLHQKGKLSTIYKSKTEKIRDTTSVCHFILDRQQVQEAPVEDGDILMIIFKMKGFSKIKALEGSELYGELFSGDPKNLCAQ